MKVHQVPWKLVESSLKVDLLPCKSVELTSMEIFMEVIHFHGSWWKLPWNLIYLHGSRWKFPWKQKDIHMEVGGSFHRSAWKLPSKNKWCGRPGSKKECEIFRASDRCTYGQIIYCRSFARCWERVVSNRYHLAKKTKKMKSRSCNAGANDGSLCRPEKSRS